MRRRSAKAHALSNLARFVRHACEIRNLSQTELTERLGIVSAATVSRWLSDQLTPSDDDLLRLADAVGTTLETLRALRVLDAVGPKASMLGTSGAFFHLANGGGSTLLLAGVTMLTGTYYFRQVALDGRTLLLSTTDPECEPARAFDAKVSGWDSGSLALAWLTSVGVVAAAQRHDPKGGRVRVWTRPYLHVDKADAPGEIVANDWVALKTYHLPGASSRFVVHFYGDEYWTKHIAPFIEGLKSTHAGFDGERLLWDSNWGPDDPGVDLLRAKLQSIQRGLDLERLLWPEID